MKPTKFIKRSIVMITIIGITGLISNIVMIEPIEQQTRKEDESWVIEDVLNTLVKSADGSENFTSVWEILSSNKNKPVTLPLESSGTYDFIVDWGDGTSNHIVTANYTAAIHTYGKKGQFVVNISGTCQGWSFNSGGDLEKIIKIQNWGNLSLGNSRGYFYGCDHLEITASDILDLTDTINLTNAFKDCAVITQVPNIGSWDVSGVINMTDMFEGVTLSVANYNDLLVGWAGLPSLQTGVSFDGGNSLYTLGGDAGDAHDYLTGVKLWVIDDAGGFADIEAPTWLEPLENQDVLIGNSFFYDVNATDNVTIAQYFINDTNNFNIDAVTGVITNAVELELGVYFLNISVNDTSGNVLSEVITITILPDSNAPEWVTIPTDQIVLEGVSFSYDVNATDDVAIAEYFINDTNNFNIDAVTGVITNASVLDLGEFSLNISVSDVNGNILSEIITITIEQDLSPPEWVTVPDDQITVKGAPFFYDVNATDNVAIAQYFINDTVNFNIDAGTGIITNASVLDLGVFSLNISVSDVNENSISQIITVTVIPDSVAPTWVTIPVDQNTVKGAPFFYDVNATDNVAIAQYFINDTANFNIDAVTGVITNASVLELGEYFLNISVNDTSGNILSEVITITVLPDSVAPTWVTIPVDQTIPEGIAFTYDIDATDNVAIAQYFINDTSNFNIDAVTGVITNAVVLEVRQYFLNISVNDTSGNILSEIITITVEQDLEAPEWVTTPVDQTIPEGIAFTYDIDATDNVAIDHYSISDTVNFSIEPNTGMITNATVLQPGNYTLTITVTDVNGNELNETITVIVTEAVNGKDGHSGGIITLLVALGVGVSVGIFFVVKNKWYLEIVKIFKKS